jgi:hypothetical protein
MFKPKVPNGFLLKGYANLNCNTNGMDSLDFAQNVNKDISWFQNYPYDISYVYNSKGFRDAEWPESLTELRNAIWCVGDSFTSGIGVEYQHIWPQLLQQKLNRRTINISLNGASNEWIRDRAIDIIEDISPCDLIIHWSYTHRRQDSFIDDNGYRQLMHNNSTEEQDRELLVQLINDVERSKKSVNVVHSFIPHYHGNEYEVYDCCRSILGIKIIKPLKQVDKARDKHHYGKLTAINLIDDILKIL